MCMFCRSFFVLFSFYFWILYGLSFIDLRILITLLISSNSSYDNDCVSGDHVAHLFVFCVLFLHFVCLRSVPKCCLWQWIVPSWLPIQFSLMFNYINAAHSVIYYTYIIRLHAYPIFYLFFILLIFVFCLFLLCFYVYFYLFLSWVTQSFMQIHDFSIAFTEMVIQSVWLFISIVFSLLKLPITYLPAIECNILLLQSKENPSWLFKCLRLYILLNNILL
jgi:hypothetical protein